MKKVLTVVCILIFGFSAIKIAEPLVVDNKTNNNINDVETSFISTPVSEEEISEQDVLGEVIPEKNLPNISYMQKALPWKTYSESESLNYSTVGLIKIPSVDVKVGVRYGTKFKKNLDSAACIAEFSTNERLYILGHNYTNELRENKIFHNLLASNIGDEVKLIINQLDDNQNVIKTDTFSYEIAYTIHITEEEYLADNSKVLTNNEEFSDYDMVLATCNHYEDGTKGRQIYYCQIKD